jgi:hypothetical protein
MNLLWVLRLNIQLFEILKIHTELTVFHEVLAEEVQLQLLEICVWLHCELIHEVLFVSLQLYVESFDSNLHMEEFLDIEFSQWHRLLTRFEF